MWKIRSVACLALGLVGLSGCAHAVQEATTNQVLDGRPAELNKATVTGRAYLITQSGKVVNCHGDDVLLIALTPNTRERMSGAFKGAETGYASRIVVEGALDDKRLDSLERRASCDAGGNFRFEHVASGQYFILAKVYWSVRWGRYGGGVLQSITVDKAEQNRLVLTHTLTRNE